MKCSTIEQETPLSEGEAMAEAVSARIASQIATDPSHRDHQQRERWRDLVRLSDVKMVHVDALHRNIWTLYDPDLHNGTVGSKTTARSA